MNSDSPQSSRDDWLGEVTFVVHHGGTETRRRAKVKTGEHRGNGGHRGRMVRRDREGAVAGHVICPDRLRTPGWWHTGGASGGKLWSKSVLVLRCPPQSLTSVAAIHCLVARSPAKGELDPVGEFVFCSRQPSRARISSPKARRRYHRDQADADSSHPKADR